MKAITITGQTPEEIQSALTKNINDLFQPTLACVFITKTEDIDAIVKMLDEHTISIFGASTSQKFSEQGISEDGIVILLMDMHRSNFVINLTKFESLEVIQSNATKLGSEGKQAFDHPAFIISTADLRIPGNEIIKGILQESGNDTTIVGGMAGEPVQFHGTVFTNHAKCNSGIVALIIDEEKVDVKGIAVSGWKPVGLEKRITKSNGNWVYTIDNEPAIPVIKKFLGNDMVVNDKSIGLDSYPLQVQRSIGKPMMRPIVSWNDEDQSIMLGAPVDEGAIFRFSLPPDLEVIETVLDSAREIKNNELPEIDALLVFSCVGRLSHLGIMLPSEIEGLAATWNKPMAGFFSLGEFGKLDDTKPEFHGTTVSWVALRER